MNVGIIGCGLIGEKRLRSLSKEDKVVFLLDFDLNKANRLFDIRKEGIVVNNLEDVWTLNFDLVFVSTTNNKLAEYTSELLKRNINVLVEKPASRNLEDLEIIKNALVQSNAYMKVGFNHRFHPAIIKAKTIVDSNTLGPIMYIRGRYGHGGRLGYEKEWRWDKEVSGGGELLDQGVHLIDLSSWFMQDSWDKVTGQIETFYWDTHLEDNAFINLSSKHRVAWLHVSATEWKNLFSFEIFCKYGKLQVDGLGGSYGVERLTQYKMLEKMGPPETTMWEYPFPDNSWELEYQYFKKCIETHTKPDGGFESAKVCLEVIDQLYKNK